MTFPIKDFILRVMLYTVFTTVSCAIFFGIIGFLDHDLYNGLSGGVVLGFGIGIGLSLIAGIDRIFKIHLFPIIDELKRQKEVVKQ